MKLKTFYFYTLKDSFFTDFPDPNLKQNKQQKRPFYICYQDSKGLFWAIPCTSQFEKYNKMIEKAEMNHKAADKWHRINLAGKDNILLIQDIIPITENYIQKPFTKNGIHQRIASSDEQHTIHKKANKIIALTRYKGRLFPSQANIIDIEISLLKNLTHH